MKQWFLALFVVAVWSGPLAAEVVDQSPAGFTSRSSRDIAASPQEVWTVLTTGVSDWWSSDHTFSGAAANLFLEPRAGGRFGEQLPDGGTVTHLDVVYADPARVLRMRGSLGPLQPLAVVGVLTVELQPHGTGTTLTATYTVGGYAPAGLAGLAGPVDGVIAAQFDRLRTFVESSASR